jgi:hypothetical protein
MMARPKFQLSRLRDIGWSLWDPIELRGLDQPDDEYDSYLMQAAGRLWNGASQEEVATYLVNIESDHMGLGHGHVEAVHEALNRYVSELRS